MGCDIHTHIEVKKDGIWYHYSTPSVNRNYRLFSHMAGVRNSFDIKPISKPKGLPKDITFITEFDYERRKEDYHSASYLRGSELIELEKRIEKYHMKEFNKYVSLEQIFNTYLFHDALTGIAKGYNKDFEDLRIVFWFDN